MDFFGFFTDPVLRGPTIGSMLMCLVAALVGVIVFLRKQSLIGEALSHAAYPGVILGVIVAGIFSIDESNDLTIASMIMFGAFVSSLAGLWSINYLQKKWRIRSDSALCFVLSTFFGIGLTLASQVQISYTSLFRKLPAYLFGQAATMNDIHIYIYVVLALIVVFTIILMFKELQTLTFNPDFAESIGISSRYINGIFCILTVLAIVIGIRSVGVLLLSAMLIAPAAAARQFSHRLPVLFFLAGFFGIISGYFGNYLSITLSHHATAEYPNSKMIIPSGPMIILVATLICIFALLFAPERGLIMRFMRASYFRFNCLSENILKSLWRLDREHAATIKTIYSSQHISVIYLRFILYTLKRNGWIQTVNGSYQLTNDGKKRAAKIVRLHRLWEVYLAEYLGVGSERVHRNAEEMEHILTPEIERELTVLLKDPKWDPHHQRIPQKEAYEYV